MILKFCYNFTKKQQKYYLGIFGIFGIFHVRDLVTLLRFTYRLCIYPKIVYIEAEDICG